MTTPALFEITSIAAKDTFTVELNNANDEPLKNAAGERLSVTVYGPGSKVNAKATAARNQRMIDRMAKKSRTKVSAEGLAEENAIFLAAITKSFNGWTHKGRNDEVGILAAYQDTTIGFITDQVQKGVDDWANFSNSGTPTT